MPSPQDKKRADENDEMEQKITLADDAEAARRSETMTRMQRGDSTNIASLTTQQEFLEKKNDASRDSISNIASTLPLVDGIENRRENEVTTPGAVAVPGIGWRVLHDDDDNDDDEQDSYSSSESSSSPPPLPEESTNHHLAEAELVDETRELQLQHEIERLRKLPQGVAVLDEQQQTHNNQARLLLFVVAAATMAVALGLGLGLGIVGKKRNDKNDVDDMMSNYTPSNFSLAGLSIFETAVNQTDFWDWLQTNVGDGPYTILAPMDASFDGTRNDYWRRNYHAHLRTLLLNHVVVAKRLAMEDFVDNTTITMLSGESFTVHVQDSTVNSTSVFFSPTFLGPGALVEPNLVPNQEETSLDVIIHGIQGILETDFLVKNALDVAVDNNLTTAVEWAEKGGILIFMKEVSHFTIFLPTNEAVEEIPLEIQQAILDNQSVLLQVLLNYAIDPLIYRQDFVNATYATIGEQEITIGVPPDGGTPTLTFLGETAHIIQTDLLPFNGVVHVLDKFFVPRNIPGIDLSKYGY